MSNERVFPSQTESTARKVDDTVQSVINNVAVYCGCALTEDRLSEKNFVCFPSSHQAVTFRAELHATREASVAELVEGIEQWIRGGVSISVHFQLLTIDALCDVSINSFTEKECKYSTDGPPNPLTEKESKHSTDGPPKDTTVEIISGTAAGVVILVLIIVMAILLRTCKRQQM